MAAFSHSRISHLSAPPLRVMLSVTRAHTVRRPKVTPYAYDLIIKRYVTPPYIDTGHGTPCPYGGGMEIFPLYKRMYGVSLIAI